MIAKFTTHNGETVGLNPATVLAVEQAPNDRARIIVGPGLSYTVTESVEIVINRLNG